MKTSRMFLDRCEERSGRATQLQTTLVANDVPGNMMSKQNHGKHRHILPVGWQEPIGQRGTHICVVLINASNPLCQTVLLLVLIEAERIDIDIPNVDFEASFVGNPVASSWS